MNREKLILKIEQFYHRDKEGLLDSKELANCFGEVDIVAVDSKEYYRLKSLILRNVGRNALEQYVRKKEDSAEVSMKLFDYLDNYFTDREIEGGLI